VGRILLAALVVILAIGALFADEKLAGARADLAAAKASTAAAVRAATDAERVARVYSAVARDAELESIRQARRADSLAARAKTLRGVYNAAAAAAPDTCSDVIAAADSLIATSDSVSQTLRAALSDASVAIASLQLGLDTTTSALIQLRNSAGALAGASTRTERRSVLQRILPKPGIGVAAGVDVLGRPSLTAGLTFGWR
jgi:hypothetical protein